MLRSWPRASISGSSPSPQPAPAIATLNNLGLGPVTFVSTVSTDDGTPWLSRNPVSGNVNPGIPVNLTVKASSAGLSAGIRRGTVRLQFSDGTIQEIAVAFV